MHIDSAHLAAFAAVLHEGSFEAAARSLFITPSAVSQRVKLLEERLGRVLIQRGSPCIATDAGYALQRHAQQVQLLEAEALTALGFGEQETQAPHTKIAVNADSLATWLTPTLARAQEICGNRFELIVEDQDHSHELLRAGRVMAAITTNAKPAQGCSVQSLGAMRYLAVASPNFFEHYFPDGVNDASLSTAPCNVFNRKDSLQKNYLELITKKRLTPPQHFVPSTHGFVEAAKHGLGWGMNPESLVEELIARGELRELKRGKHLDVPLYWQCWRLESVSLKALTAEVLREAKRALVRLRPH
jgi:LysR family transcriptional regulator, chromosome initiation inhibitor